MPAISRAIPLPLPRYVSRTKTKITFKRKRMCIISAILFLPLLWSIVVFFYIPLIHWKKVFSAPATFQSGVGQHPDKETQLFLNYLSGYDSLPVKKREELACKMTLTEIEYVRRTKTRDLREALTFEERYQFFLNRIIVPSLPKNESLHTFLWQTEIASGSPKIRFVVEKHFSKKRPYRENYAALSNTMYINFFNYKIGERRDSCAFTNVPSYLCSFLSEVPHAKQYYENPVQSALKLSGSGIRISWKWLTQNFLVKLNPFTRNASVSWIDIYTQHEYRRRGSIEYEAHEVLQKRLEQELSVALQQKPTLAIIQ